MLDGGRTSPGEWPDAWHNILGTLRMRKEGRPISTDIVVKPSGVLQPTGDYAVEAEIQLLRYTDEGMISGVASFGIVARGQDDGSGYTAGPCVSSGIFSCTKDQPTQRVAALWAKEGRTTLDVRPFRPAGEWHRYRVEVRGNTLTVQIDGNLALSATDNTYRNGGKVGLWSNRCQISVRSFEVTPL